MSLSTLMSISLRENSVSGNPDYRKLNSRYISRILGLLRIPQNSGKISSPLLYLGLLPGASLSELPGQRSLRILGLADVPARELAVAADVKVPVRPGPLSPLALLTPSLAALDHLQTQRAGGDRPLLYHLATRC